MKKSYWYAYSFTYLSNERNQVGSCYLGQSKKMITKGTITEAKKSAKMPDGSVLVAVTYCGYMTVEDFKDGEE